MHRLFIKDTVVVGVLYLITGLIVYEEPVCKKNLCFDPFCIISVSFLNCVAIVCWCVHNLNITGIIV